MRQPKLLGGVLVFLLSGLLAACKSEAERERKVGREMQARSSVASDGSIRLTPEQVQANKLQTAAVTEQNLAPSITALGRIVAHAGGESQVFAPFAGRLIADPAKLPHVGGVVNKGQVLAEVEQLVTPAEQAQLAATAAQLQSTFEQAQQEVQLRQTELGRSKQLYEGGAIPLKQLQATESDLKQAQARLKGAGRAKAQYDAILSEQNAGPRRAPIRAPISGTVVAADLTAGQQIEPSKSLLTIVDLHSVWVEVAVHESDLPAVRRTNQVEFTTVGNPGRAYTGRLITIGNLVDPANRTISVIFSVSNPDKSLKIGMTAEARIPTGPSANVLLIPASAMLSMEGEPTVYVEIEPGVYRRRAITTGESRGERLVIYTGLKPGEKVVAAGAGSLRSEALKSQIPTEEETDKR